MSGRFTAPLRSGESSRRLTKRVPTEDGRGHTWQDDGREEFSYEINIDWRHVQQMIATAADNRGGQSIAGPIQVKVSKRKNAEA